MNKKELPPLHKDMYYFGYGIDIEKPIEMANKIIELQQENKQLKQKYENAVADYETTMFEKEQLNSLVNSCQEEIRQLKKQLEERPKEYVFVGNAQNKTRDFIDQIIKENQELKKKLENKYEKVGTLTSELLYEENTKLINQQKKFIKYLEDEIKFYKNRDSYMVADIHGSYDLNDIELKLLEEILQKYKEITGVSDAKEN